MYLDPRVTYSVVVHIKSEKESESERKKDREQVCVYERASIDVWMHAGERSALHERRGDFFSFSSSYSLSRSLSLSLSFTACVCMRRLTSHASEALTSSNRRRLRTWNHARRVKMIPRGRMARGPLEIAARIHIDEQTREKFYARYTEYRLYEQYLGNVIT